MSHQAGNDEDGVGSVMGLKTMCPVKQDEVRGQESLTSSRSFQCSKVREIHLALALAPNPQLQLPQGFSPPLPGFHYVVLVLPELTL